MLIIKHIHDILEHSVLIPVARADAPQQSVTQLLGLDWKLFVAQLINFAIVMLVLWKWVFTPLTKKLSERTEKIDKSLAQARDIEEQHRLAGEERIKALENARKEATEIIEKAQKLAVQSKDEILADARKAAERIAEQNKVQLADQKDKLLREVREEAASMVVFATEKILREKLDAKKDQEIIKEYLKDI